jgi:hypothetical protein
MFGSTPYKDTYYNEEHSTGYKTGLNLEENEKQYNALVRENTKLQEQIHIKDLQPLPFSKNLIYSPQELERISESLISGPKVHYENVAPQAGEDIVIEKICPYMISESIALTQT